MVRDKRVLPSSWVVVRMKFAKKKGGVKKDVSEGVEKGVGGKEEPASL